MVEEERFESEATALLPRDFIRISQVPTTKESKPYGSFSFKSLGKEIKWKVSGGDKEYTLVPWEWYLEKGSKTLVAAVSDDQLPVSGTIVVEKFEYKGFTVAILRREVVTTRDKTCKVLS